MPWEAVLREAADSQAFWYQELLEPALLLDRAHGAQPSPAHQAYEDDSLAEATAAALSRKHCSANVKGGGKKGAAGKVDICFTFIRHASGCQEPCPAKRLHVCEGCGAPNVRAINCCYKDGPLVKKTKVKGKGMGKGKGGAASSK